MDGLTIGTFLGLLRDFGPFAVLLVIWWVDGWRYNKLRDQDKERYAEAEARAKEDLAKVVRMYESNVDLVRAHQRVVQDLHDTVVLNTQAWVAVRGLVETNQFCPMVRLQKQTPGKVEG